ncbi:hypothetical protein EAI_13365, partial [Harpegnathos saltator]
LQYYRCLERGHVQQNCSSEIDRRNNCYRCGEMDHLARNCTKAAKCVVCAEAGKPAGHRMGGPACR